MAPWLVLGLTLWGGQEGPRRVEVNESRSSVVMVARLETAEGAPTGRAVALTPDDWDAEVCFDATLPHRSSVRFRAKADSLKVDREEARKQAGLKPGEGMSGEEAQALERRIREYVMAEEYPYLRFQSLSARPVEGKLVFEGPAMMLGRSALVSVEVTVEASDPETLWMRGEFPVRLSGFNRPAPSLSEELRVGDEIGVRFSLVGRTRKQACR